MQILSVILLLGNLALVYGTAEINPVDNPLTYVGTFNMSRDWVKMFNYTISDGSLNSNNFGIGYYTQSFFTTYANNITIQN